MSRLRLWLPVALCAAVMWTLSTGSFSSEHTSQGIIPLLRWLLPYASTATLETIHLGIRKSAHVTEYFIFSLLVLRALRAGRAWRLQWALLAILIAAAYGGTDEIHQIFVPQRGPSVVDVMIDTSGATLAQLIAWLWLRRRKQITGTQIAP